ncbi:uncharacterized protein J4E88_006594 [Alternaria novae-zelandiae]|uniref:uncharacterized protein n=1 Tax=Alternaria novae-zelandiae TaxID=430562 RepID=UPI0020C1F3F1|nr:uncharacterized protein J4E88_006594 [Alternaria novae-zelandiae]KAI4678076.1 hypothetical protein J4E88_006594 [Alternaria novae-zelandiae]
MHDPDRLGLLWPLDGPGCLLVTSQDPSFARKSGFSTQNSMLIEGFNNEESGRMLERLTRRSNGGRVVAERIGGLPLAIAQIAALIHQNNWTFEEFVQALDTPRNKDPEDETASLSYVFDLVLSRLQYAKSLLDVLSLLDPDGIPEAMLKQYSIVAIEGYPTSDTAYAKARRELIRSSLIQRDNSLRNVMIHRLVTAYTQSKMSDARYREVFSAATRLLAQIWPFETLGWRGDILRWRKCEQLLPHILNLKRNEPRVIDSAKDDLSYCMLINNAGLYYCEIGQFAESQIFTKHAQSIAEAIRTNLKESSVGTEISVSLCDAVLAETFHNLGRISAETNQPDATLANFSRYNAMLLDQPNGGMQMNANRLAVSWFELGNAFMINQLWAEGERCFDRGMSIARRIENFAPWHFSQYYIVLGLVYCLTDRIDQATKVLEEGLQHRESVRRQDTDRSFVSGLFWYALGNVTASQGTFGQSLDYHEKALRQFSRTIGADHHHTGDVHVRIAEHYFRLKDFTVAK